MGRAQSFKEFYEKRCNYAENLTYEKIKEKRSGQYAKTNIGEQMLVETPSAKAAPTRLEHCADKSNGLPKGIKAPLPQALILSQVVIIPCIASQFDIAVLEKMINILLEVKATINPNLKVFFVLSRATTNLFLSQKNTNLKDYLIETLKENEAGEDFILLDSVIYEREAYKSAIIEGLSIFEFCKESDKAYMEFEGFYEELVGKL